MESMTGADGKADRPAIDGAIHNPGNGDHFMAIKPVTRRIRVYRGERLIADTVDAVRVLEVYQKIYDPVVYIPPGDLAEPLEPVDKSTRCPLKGKAAYFAFDGEEIGWSYPEPFEFSKALAGLHAFWPDKVRIIEGE